MDPDRNPSPSNSCNVPSQVNIRHPSSMDCLYDKPGLDHGNGSDVPNICNHLRHHLHTLYFPHKPYRVHIQCQHQPLHQRYMGDGGCKHPHPTHTSLSWQEPVPEAGQEQSVAQSWPKAEVQPLLSFQHLYSSCWNRDHFSEQMHPLKQGQPKLKKQIYAYLFFAICYLEYLHCKNSNGVLPCMGKLPKKAGENPYHFPIAGTDFLTLSESSDEALPWNTLISVCSLIPSTRPRSVNCQNFHSMSDSG